MIFAEIQALNDDEFYHLTGINRVLFSKLVKAKRKAIHNQFDNTNILDLTSDSTNNYSIEESLLMTLRYWKEYPTFFQMSLTYKMSPSSCYRNISWVENNLANHPDFQLLNHDNTLKQKFSCEDETLIIDATEIPIEKLKKRHKLFFWQKLKTCR